MQTVYIPMLKQIYEQNPSPLVRDQAVYAMARICDYELFTWLIENENIDDTLKISVIERNFRLMKDQRYYHSDYFTLNTAGRYVMQVFSIDDLQHPLAVDFFYVK